MAQFDLDVLSRLPLAESVLTVLKYLWDDEELSRLFDQHRGTGSEVKVTFSLLVDLVVNAIVEYQGSGRESFRQARSDGRLDATDGAVYGKLRRIPVRLSEAFLLETTRRLRSLLPVDADPAAIPPAFRNYRVLVVDGKKLKNLPKRMKPLREVSGKVLGGKVVVGMMLNEGMAVAMHASPDGEANDAPLTPGLLEQVEGTTDQPVIVVADRQFCGLKIPQRIVSGESDFVIRYSNRMRFFPERERHLTDSEGRLIGESWGMLGREKEPARMYLRQITLHRPGEQDVILVTSLLDADAFPAEQMLQLYLGRWNIERLFQQVTTVFHVQRLVGTSPQGAIFQFSLCTCLYNVIQLVRSYVAAANHQPAERLSSEMIFRDVSRQFVASTQFVSQSSLLAKIPSYSSAHQVRERLGELIAGAKWSPLWLKTPRGKRPKPKPKKRIPGGHCSAYKLIQQAKHPP